MREVVRKMAVIYSSVSVILTWRTRELVRQEPEMACGSKLRKIFNLQISLRVFV
jgi:hypothetical protein